MKQAHPCQKPAWLEHLFWKITKVFTLFIHTGNMDILINGGSAITRAIMVISVFSWWPSNNITQVIRNSNIVINHLLFLITICTVFGNTEAVSVWSAGCLQWDPLPAVGQEHIPAHPVLHQPSGSHLPHGQIHSLPVQWQTGLVSCSVLWFLFTHHPVLSALLPASRFLAPDFPLLVPSSFLSSVPLHGMTFPFLSDRNPLLTPSDQTSGQFFSQNYRPAMFSISCCSLQLSLHPSQMCLLPIFELYINFV